MNAKKCIGIAVVALLLSGSLLLVSQPASAAGTCWGNTGGETCVGVAGRGCLVYLDSDAANSHDNCVYLEQ